MAKVFIMKTEVLATCGTSVLLCVPSEANSPDHPLSRVDAS